MAYGQIASTFGFLLQFMALAMLLPIGWSIYYGDKDWSSFLWAGALIAPLGWLMRRRGTPGEIGIREAFVIVSGAWALAAAAGALPFLLSGSLPSFTDSYFEAMSGLTTTGATVVTDIEALPHGILFWRSFLHWIGGMGIILVFLAVLPRLGVGGSHLFRAEVPGPIPEKLRPRIRDTAKVLWSIYIVLSLLETGFLLMAGLSLFDALIHTFGTMATGGFSSLNKSIEGLANPLAEVIIVVFMVLAGTNFALYYRALRERHPGVLLRDREFRAFLMVLAGASLMVSLTLMRDLSLPGSQAFKLGIFQVVSITTTTGFTTADFEEWPHLAKGILFVLMFVGASAGSTGGSVKVIRWVIILKHGLRELYRLVHSSAVLPLRCGDSVFPEESARQIFAFITLYVLSFVGASLAMMAMGLDMVSAGASVAATLGNVGPGFGLVRPSANYAAIPQAGKMLLSFMMLLGRLEILGVLVLFMPGFWRQK